MTRAKDISKIITDADFSGTLDVTGTLTASGLTSSQPIESSKTSSNYGAVAEFNAQTSNVKLRIDDLSNNSATERLYITHNTNRDSGTQTADDATLGVSSIKFSDGSLTMNTISSGNNIDKPRLNIANNGDISFYEDTGTTPKFFWDSSAEALGIGTSLPNYQLHATSTFAVGASGFNQQLSFTNDTIQSLVLGSGYTALKLNPLGGNVGIGTTSPGDKLEVDGIINIKRLNQLSVLSTTATGVANFEFGFNKSGSTTRGMPNDTAFINMRQGYPIIIATQETERMRITDGGRVGIGASSPETILHVRAVSAIMRLVSDTNSTSGVDFGDTADTNIGRLLYDHTDNSMRFTTNTSERMRINSAGNITVTDGSIASGVTHTFNLFGATGTGGSANYVTYSFVGDPNTGMYSGTADTLKFATGGSERFRINSSGTLLWSSTVDVDSSNAGISFFNSTHPVINVSGGADTNFRHRIVFHNGNGVVGIISTSGSSTTYGTSSDHRLKENVTADWDATTRLKQLNPVRFNFIADADTTVDGFLAHEVQSVVPEAITGTHNEVDDNGNPVYQGIDQSKLVPLLVKTIQELEARIVALETA